MTDLPTDEVPPKFLVAVRRSDWTSWDYFKPTDPDVEYWETQTDSEIEMRGLRLVDKENQSWPGAPLCWLAWDVLGEFMDEYDSPRTGAHAYMIEKWERKL